MKKIFLNLAIISCISSCAILGKKKEISFNKKGSPVYMKNGVKAEKVLTEDSKAPLNYVALSKPIAAPSAIKAKDLGSFELESFQANIASDKNGSISYTFFNPTTNEYFSNVSKKSIVGIKIMKDSMSCKVANYKFTSQINGKREPMSVVFILDHSGSMGDDRANIVQIALDSAINYKHKDDEITLIKFDHETKKLITSTNKKDLQGLLKPIGLQGFGFTTAIQDALKLGVEELNNAKYKDKLIVLLTDGCENSSKIATDLVDLVSNAKKSKVVVNTIGFGEYVDVDYLSFLSNETGGYFRQLFSRNEIKNVFNHNMHRMNNNFKINFTPCMFGDSLKLITKVKLNDSVFVNEKMIFTPFSLGESIELNVLFDTDKFNIKQEYNEELNSFVAFMKKNKKVQVEISGHTDSDSDEKYNLKLSQNRADEIKKYIVSKGIEASRITTVGYGESKPKYPNDSPENKAMNRRIEAKIINM
jgi:flagellar motor protein MotB